MTSARSRPSSSTSPSVRLRLVSLITSPDATLRSVSLSASPAENGHLKLSRPRLVPARPKVCARHVCEPLRFSKTWLPQGRSHPPFARLGSVSFFGSAKRPRTLPVPYCSNACINRNHTVATCCTSIERESERRTERDSESDRARHGRGHHPARLSPRDPGPSPSVSRETQVRLHPSPARLRFVSRRESQVCLCEA